MSSKKRKAVIIRLQFFAFRFYSMYGNVSVSSIVYVEKIANVSVGSNFSRLSLKKAIPSF